MRSLPMLLIAATLSAQSPKYGVGHTPSPGNKICAV